MSEYKNQSELEFEAEVIEHLTHIGGVKQWQYMPEIKTTEQLWQNFKKILEQNNQARLDYPLSPTEFAQIKKIISSFTNPYQAGQFLYGINGVSEIEVDLDNGKHVFLTVFDQSQVGGGNTVYQVVNQIERPKVVDGKKDRRFDVTLLINGLPIVQIELKKSMHSANEALNQMQQYIAEKQYSDIFSTLQILVAMTPREIRYMANTKEESFNKAFAFNWQNEDDAKPVYSWKTFTDRVLSIPMAHDLATRYMVLDGTKNKESIKVMRPYQVYATKRVLEAVNKFKFDTEGKLGYVWHTTGSGKTITSFKTAWLASRLPHVDKVVFLVDRIALTNQTADAYKAYDPATGSEDKAGVVSDTASVQDLHRKLTRKSDKNIIVTSIQKMSRYVSRKDFKAPKDNILFIVDEAHRSTGQAPEQKAHYVHELVESLQNDSTEGMLQKIREALPTSAWVAYTGTPKFPETRQIFGGLLHAYTIKEAIADKNVLGFNVEFKETIKAPEDATLEDMDDNIKASVYDTSDEHVKLVVEDIFKYWKNRSNDGKYNALLTVHVGGNKASTPRAMQYFNRFQGVNATLPQEERLKVAVSFSDDTSNSNHQLEHNETLLSAMQRYNKEFGTAFDMKQVKEYTEDVSRRLNKTAGDGNFLDLVIVVDQLLTGFDAPEMNTLYVDRTLKGANLIQAYSRTNRMHNLVTKPWGNVVNYRWPQENKHQMNKAFYLYSNRNSALEQDILDIPKEELSKANSNAGITSQPIEVVLDEAREVVGKLRELTDNFTDKPKGEHAEGEFIATLNQYNQIISQLKQYTVNGDDEPISMYTNPDYFYGSIGLSCDEEGFLNTVRMQLEETLKREVPGGSTPVELEMVHIIDVRIDYDYLVDLIALFAEQVHCGNFEAADETRKSIETEIAKTDNDKERKKVRKFVDKIYDKEFEFDSYPVTRDVDEMQKAMDKAQHDGTIRLLTGFVRHWGLDNSITPNDLKALISKHKVGEEDLDKQGELNKIMLNARQDYKEIASLEVTMLSWVKYRNEFRTAFYELADTIMEDE